MYCADGGSDADHCCNPKERWDSVDDRCEGTTMCNPGSCSYEPFTTNWWLTDGCFLMSSSEACCNVGLKYGYPNYYDYTDADEDNNIETY